MTETAFEPVQHRASLARLLALADWALVRDLTADIAEVPHSVLRGPECGLVMLRGRMGATGAAFNFGEATAMRCSVRLADASEGHAYVLGRNGSLALRMALCDALIQSGSQSATLTRVAEALERSIEERRMALASKVAATKVDFFTVVRGDA